MKADINTIAEKCSVSKATVSRVFTGKAGVRETVKERILKAARELNYAPQKVAAQENICIVGGSIKTDNMNEFYYTLTTKLVAAITCGGYTVKIIPEMGIDLLLKEYTKVVIFLNDIETCGRQLKDLPIPLLLVNQVCESAHSICIDHADEIEQAVDYLVGKGHRKNAIILDCDTNWGGRERHRGYQVAMARHQLPPLPEFCYQQNNRSMIEVMAKLRRTAATAVIVCGEGLVMETNYALNILGITVPDDLSLISFAQKNISRWMLPPHTSINQDINVLSDKIMETVMEISGSPLSRPIRKMLKSELIIRETVKDISRPENI